MEPYKNKKLWIVLAAAALVVILLVVLTVSQSGEEQNRITLPTSSGENQPQTQTDAASKFTEISTANVQTIIEGLSRPEHYHQTLSVSAEFEGSIRNQTAEVWKSGDVYRISIEETSGTRNVLTDGQTLYLWYTGDQSASEIRLDSSVSADDLIGVPTYEQILSLPKSQIEEANFVVLPELENESCVFISTKLDDTADYYWVSLSSGLLCRQTSLYQNAPLRSTLQTAFTTLSAEDSNLRSQLQLPDGTTPFAKQG